MRVTLNNTTDFGSVKVGQYFSSNNNFFIKIGQKNIKDFLSPINAVEIITGDVWYFEDTDKVHLYKDEEIIFHD